MFGLHPLLLVTTIAGYFLFLGIMAAAFINPALAIPFAIFFLFVAMAFGVPGLWAKVAATRGGRLQTWSEFRHEGLQVATGSPRFRRGYRQVLILPTLIVEWGAAIALIVALL